MAKPTIGSSIWYSIFDCLVVKVRQDKRIINKSVYIALGIDLSGRKDILGLWISGK